ncbi:MAG: hypothetical protein IJG24_04910 [Selenomonadaceae bacterium]|nr:hypothetical protein [Selenomonadaceae bacterium]
MTYSYDPTQINDGGLNQMRFELGDCLVQEPEKTCYLNDAEICEAIAGASSWKRAKLRLIESLLFRFAYEVNQEIREAKWELSDRFDFWEKLRKRLADEIAEEDSVSAFGFLGKRHRPPIFRIGMHDWRR